MNEGYFAAAYFVFWVIFFVYLIFLHWKLLQIEKGGGGP